MGIPGAIEIPNGVRFDNGTEPMIIPDNLYGYGRFCDGLYYCQPGYNAIRCREVPGQTECVLSSPDMNRENLPSQMNRIPVYMKRGSPQQSQRNPMAYLGRNRPQGWGGKRRIKRSRKIRKLGMSRSHTTYKRQSSRR